MAPSLRLRLVLSLGAVLVLLGLSWSVAEHTSGMLRARYLHDGWADGVATARLPPKPDVTLSHHPAPQDAGSCHENLARLWMPSRAVF